MPLTDAAIRNAKAGESVKKLSDGGGLQLWITPQGSKLWRLAYRDAAGKQKKLSIGPYPAIGLADARKRRDEAKSILASGGDPAEHHRATKAQSAAAAAATFAVVAAEYRAKLAKQGRAESTLTKLDWLLSFALPKLGSRPICEIKAHEVLAVLRTVEAKGTLETAKRLRATIGAVIRYAIATARADSDPTTALQRAIVAPKVTHRAAITDPIEFGGLLRAIDSFHGQPTTIAALKLMALLFPRPGELRMAEWQEFDLANAVWTIPGSRTKMRRPHEIPLPRQALEILESLRPITGHGALVFPGFGMSGGIGRKIAPKPISENTLNGALRRLGYMQEHHSAHGFRASASTLLNQSGKFSPDAIERALAHQDPDAVRRAYARGAYWQERVEMAQWWADYLDRLRQGGVVIDLKPARQKR
ncbi:MAG: integrase arm-type DNA-binding domain-containing protein [Beijerinckiaceae bacterium]|nr:integrase arm-type DNA-binding domain-containing protein [Beijerinckiaceae bacterium]